MLKTLKTCSLCKHEVQVDKTMSAAPPAPRLLLIYAGRSSTHKPSTDPIQAKSNPRSVQGYLPLALARLAVAVIKRALGHPGAPRASLAQSAGSRRVLVVARARPTFATVVLDAAQGSQYPIKPTGTAARLQRSSMQP